MNRRGKNNHDQNSMILNAASNATSLAGAGHPDSGRSNQRGYSPKTTGKESKTQQKYKQ